MSRTLLIDADILAYQAAASNQTVYDFGDDGTQVVADFKAAQRHAKETLDYWVSALDAKDFIICLSDDVTNYRKRISTTYKSNRSKTERPVHLYDMKDWLAETYHSWTIPTLEADDVMGILSTTPHSGDRIIVSEDKDMLTIPGLLYRPHEAAPRVISVTPEQADRYHLYQTLIGDATDGYPGCPGVGPAKTAAILDDLMGWEPSTHVFTRGPREGQSETRWVAKQYTTRWDAIVSVYHKAGLKESDALVQARLARILRHDEYNGRPILWEPRG
jgi:DNA polymerase-1